MEKKKTIGVLVGGITDDFTRCLCDGVKKAAEDSDVNVVVFPGKFLDRDYAENLDIRYEYQYETLFSYATKYSLDGLIVAANCIGCCTTRERLVEFMQQYKEIPCVLVASDIDGFVSVNFDNYQGIKEGLEYLIEVLHCKKIGMVGGPAALSDNVARRNAYESVLRAHGIEPEEKLYIEKRHTTTSREVYEKLLDDNPDIEAVFCVNDETAAELYEELKKRNRMPGKDISVFGYDNVSWCTQMFPTLSSVSADVSVLGIESFRLLCRMMNGEDVQSVNLPTKFVRRNSVCRPSAMPEEDREEVFEQYLTMNHWMEEQRGKQNRTNFEMKQFIAKILQFEKANDQSYAEILGTMDWLEIYNAFLFTFDKPIIHLNHEKFELPDYLYLKANQSKGKVRSVPAVKQKMRVRSIFDMKRLGIGERAMLVVLPLYSNEILYGILLCDLSEGVMENGEFLGNLMSATVKMIELLKTNDSIMKKLEQSLAVLEENNLELNNLSKRDPLTGILNRRGFFLQAEPMLEKCRSEQKEVTVLYVDMNNLKIINDRYGHEEGDYSLRTIAEILKEQVGKYGVVARIGGDEYACVLTTVLEDGQILEKIYAAFEKHNNVSDKPYNVTVSIGAYRILVDDGHTLEDAMTLADEQLYEVKRLRTKNVAKVQQA